MKNRFNKFFTYAALAGLLGFSVSCSNDDSIDDQTGGETENPTTEDSRWFTVAGAIMDETPGNGNGGTILYSISKEDAQNPDFEVDVFKGYQVRSQRTARLQSSVDGATMFNIAYGGDIGGEFSKYNVEGGADFVPTGGVVNISQYAGTSPRWVKLFDGDKTGVAASVTSPQVNEGDTYEYTRGTATLVSIDMEDVLISKNNSFEIPLQPEEELLGHYIFRLDAPVLNAAKDKLIVGTWMGKTDPATGERDANPYERLGSKSVIVDYPSLENPTIITSTVGHGDTSGYRSFNSFLGDDGSIYQATQRDSEGSHILKINADNTYDNTYVFSLDNALSITNSYIESWRYVGNGIAYVMYTHDGASASNFNTGQQQSFLARVDLNARTAARVDLPYDPDMYFFQYQGFAVDGDNVYVSISPVGKDGNIYILNSVTGDVTKGAKLLNESGNHFIGVF